MAFDKVAAQPSDSPTALEARRRATACRVLGELYCRRYRALPAGPDRVEPARAVAVLQGLASDAIPEPLRIVVGAAADGHVQAAEGDTLLNDALTVPGPVLLDATVILLTAAAAGIDRGHPRPAVSPGNLFGAPSGALPGPRRPKDPDEDGATARAFYGRLSDASTAGHAAATRHAVTRDLRDQYPTRPHPWAPLVRTGP